MHGPVFSMKKGTQTFIVIGRYNVRSHLVLSSSQADHAQAAIEIMENHWSSLVDRPQADCRFGYHVGRNASLVHICRLQTEASTQVRVSI